MFEKTRYYRPWLAWLGVRVVRDDGEAAGVLGSQEQSVRLSVILKRYRYQSGWALLDLQGCPRRR
jgi:hypothetical protein